MTDTMPCHNLMLLYTNHAILTYKVINDDAYMI